MAVAAVIATATPATATADEVIAAETVWRYGALSYTIDQGELLTFRNNDLISPGPHDVTSEDVGPDRRPLFQSPTIGNGQEAPVEGARQLVTGSYAFVCSVHPIMQATLVVTAQGVPLPPPGSEPTPPGSSPPSQSSQPGDTQAPRVRAVLGRVPLRRALRSRGFPATVRVDEAATLRITLTARAGRRTFRVGAVSVRYSTAGRDLPVRVRATRAAARALRRARRATLVLAVQARDAAGNLGAASARRTVRR